MRFDFDAGPTTFSPDGTKIACTSDDNSIRLWDTLNALQTSKTLQHTESVSCFAFSSDGRRLASCDDKSKKERLECTHQLISALVASGDDDSLREAMDLLLGTDTLSFGRENFDIELGEKWWTELAESWNLALALCLIRCKEVDRQRALVFVQTAYTQAKEKITADPSTFWIEFAAYWNTTSGWILASNGQHEMAKESLKEAVIMKDHDFQDLLFLSLVLRDSGDKTAASETLRKSLTKLDEH